jgi:hypothetical protein
MLYLDVCSEGNSLTEEDEKTYWGGISYEDEEETEIENESPDASRYETRDDQEDRRLIVKGSVIFGYGLEPQPVGRFVMTQSSEEELDYDEEEDDDDDGHDDENVTIDSSSDEEMDDYSDWSKAFQ